MGLRELISFILNPINLPSYRAILIIFIVLSFNGVVLFQAINRTKNKLLLLGGGMIFGILGYLFILSIFSYFLKGSNAILIFFVFYFLICLAYFIKNISKYKKIIKGTNLNLSSFIFGFILVAYLIIIFFIASSAVTGGDVITYWGIATSFARGNYPTVLPWQPNFLTVYHTGALIVQGAIHSLSSVSISIVHFFFSTYTIFAIFLFITGIAREKTRSFFSLLPAIFGLFLFGGPIILVTGYGEFVTNLVKIFSTSFKEAVMNLSLYPQLAQAKGSAGAGAVTLDGLIYVNFQALGLASFVFLLFFLLKKAEKSILKKYIFLTTIAVLLLSIDETYFIIAVPLLGFFYLLENRKEAIKKIISRSVILLVVFVTLFLVIQNPVRDSMIVKSPEAPRFKLINRETKEFKDRINFIKSKEFLASQYKETGWYLPHLNTILLVILSLAIWKKSKIGVTFALASILSLFFSLKLVNTFWPANSLRFITRSYNLIILAMGFLMVNLYKKRYTKSSLFIFLAGFIIIFPQILSAHGTIIKNSLFRRGDNFIRNLNYRNDTLDWIREHIPYDKKFIFVDEYPAKGLYSPVTLDAVQYYGFFTPSAPPNIKVLNRDKSGEWYDSVTSLSPKALKELGVDYVYIKYSALPRLSLIRKKQLKDPMLFNKIYENENGVLYNVSFVYKALEGEEITIQGMVEMIPNNSVVYIDKLKLTTPRKALILALAKRTKLYGPRPNVGGDYFMYIETFSPFNSVTSPDEVQHVNFVFITPGKQPDLMFDQDCEFIKIAEMPHLSLWENCRK